MNDQLTLVSYVAPGSSFSDSTAYQQVIYQQATGTFAPGTHSLTVQIPNSYYQIDFVCGQAINQLEPNQNGNAYGPDSANILYHAEGRYLDSDNGGTKAANPMPAPHPEFAAGPLDDPHSDDRQLTDTATLSGGINPTGTITFTLYNPSHVAVYTDTVTVSGNGTYDTSTGTNPGGYLPTVGGHLPVGGCLQRQRQQHRGI